MTTNTVMYKEMGETKTKTFRFNEEAMDFVIWMNSQVNFKFITYLFKGI